MRPQRGERVCAVCLCKSQAKIVFKDREREGEHHIRIKNEVEVWIGSESWIGLRMLMRMISLGELIRVQESIMLPVIFPLENPPTRFSELFSNDVGDPV